jgi:hypothetical protein
MWFCHICEIQKKKECESKRENIRDMEREKGEGIGKRGERE